jgi:hypothetical protein
MRRVAPAIVLFVLSPLVAEFLLGNIAIDAVANVVFLAPLYGGGALLIREVTRRTGRGWPTMMLLGFAFAVFEEGLITQTLFNPSYFGHDLIGPTHLPALGIGVWWTVFVLTLHTVWSTSVSIAMAEALIPARSTSPWLGRVGVGVTGVLVAAGAALSFYGTYEQERFLATPAQLGLSAVCVAAVVTVALTLRRPAPSAAPVKPAPRPVLVGGVTLAASSLFMIGRDIATWQTVAAWLLLFTGVGALLVRWSRRDGWGAAHRLAMAGGALLTYAWVGFPAVPLLGSTGIVDRVGNVVFALGAVALILVSAARTAPRPRATDSHRQRTAGSEIASRVGGASGHR